MSYNEKLQKNNTELQDILNTANELPTNAVDEKTVREIIARETEDLQPKTDNTLLTDNQTVVGAINETLEVAKNKTTVIVDGKAVKEFNTDSKQDVVAFDGGYDKNTNKAATVKTVTDKIAEVIANAPDDLDTLEEIARWITEHPNSVAEINAKIAANTKSIQERVKYDDFWQGFKVYDNGLIGLESNTGALESRVDFPVLGGTMDEAWKMAATDNRAEWTPEDWEKFYAFIGAVKDYHNNRDGLARFNDGRLSVSDPSLKSPANVVNVRTLLKRIEEANAYTDAAVENKTASTLKEAKEYTDTQVDEAASATDVLAAQIPGQIYNSAKINSYKIYSGPGNTQRHHLVPGGFYMVFSGDSDLQLVDPDQGGLFNHRARQIVFMTVPYSAESMSFVAIGMYFYSGSFSITNPKIPMEFFQVALDEGSYIAAGEDSEEMVHWTVSQHVGGINE